MLLVMHRFNNILLTSAIVLGALGSNVPVLDKHSPFLPAYSSCHPKPYFTGQPETIYYYLPIGITYMVGRIAVIDNAEIDLNDAWMYVERMPDRTDIYIEDDGKRVIVHSVPYSGDIESSTPLTSPAGDQIIVNVAPSGEVNIEFNNGLCPRIGNT